MFAFVEKQGFFCIEIESNVAGSDHCCLCMWVLFAIVAVFDFCFLLKKDKNQPNYAAL